MIYRTSLPRARRSLFASLGSAILRMTCRRIDSFLLEKSQTGRCKPYDQLPVRLVDGHEPAIVGIFPHR